MTRALAWLAAGAPARVFPVVGWGGRDRLIDLRRRGGIELCDSPRAATVLLLAGRLPRGLVEPAMRAHDQLPGPRLVVRWPASPDDADDGGVDFPGAVVVDAAQDLATQLAGCQRELVTGQRPSSERLLLDVDPVPWRGVGPYGTGGKGMTGGTPYGRPLAERAPDRDGLELDQLALRVGPLLPTLPAGLVLGLRLQGDVIQAVTVGDNPFVLHPGDPPRPAPARGAFVRALDEPVPVVEVELARARHHLRSVSEVLRVLGLPALGARALHAAALLDSDGGRLARRLASRLLRAPGYAAALGRAGRLDGEDVAGRGLGPVARAAGVVEDDRSRDPAYRALGFAPVTGREGDTLARFRQRLFEIVQALDLAAAAGSRTTSPAETVEAPRGPISRLDRSPSSRLLGLLPGLLDGLEWGDAVAAVASLDLDMEEAATVTERAAA